MEKALRGAYTQSISASPVRSVPQQQLCGNARSPPLLFPGPCLLLPPTHSKEKKKQFPEGREFVKSTGRSLKEKKDLLKTLFNCTSIDGKSTQEPRNFPNATEVITLIQNIGSNLKVWDHLEGAKDVFSNLRMSQMKSPELNKFSQLCAERVSLLLHLS